MHELNNANTSIGSSCRCFSLREKERLTLFEETHLKRKPFDEIVVQS